MTDPIQRESPLIAPLIAWVRKNRFEAARRLIIWSALGGVILYIVGEVLSHDRLLNVGIWILLASLAAGILFKFVAIVVGFFDEKNRQ